MGDCNQLNGLHRCLWIIFFLSITNICSAIERAVSDEAVVIIEQLIKAPPEIVWPYYQSDRLHSWAPAHHYTPVSGSVGSTGHRYQSVERGQRYPIIHYQVLQAVKPNLYVVRLATQQQANSPATLIGYSAVSFDAVDQGTRLRNTQILIFDPDLSAADQQRYQHQLAKALTAAYGELKKQVEGAVSVADP